MRTSIYLTLAIIIGFLSSGCDWNDDDSGPTTTTFTGQVVDDSTKEPVGNVRIFIGAVRREFPTSKSVDSRSTISADGSFSFEFNIEEEVDYFRLTVSLFDENDFLIQSFTNEEQGLFCVPGDCSEYLPGRDYDIVVSIRVP